MLTVAKELFNALCINTTFLHLILLWYFFSGKNYDEATMAQLREMEKEVCYILFHLNNIFSILTNVKTQNKQLKEAAYRTYVRPQVEYCSTILHPWQKHLTHRIEMVQRSAARYVQNDYLYTSSVTNMLRELK